jgi:hypothetical protein
MGRENQRGHDNFALESDKRFNKTIRRLAVQARRNAVVQQTKQQETVAAHFKDNQTINFHSIIRQPDATGGENLVENLNPMQDKPRLILLLNGIVNPQDIVQVSPFVERWGMKVLRLQQRIRNRVSRVCDDTVAGDSIPDYIAKTVETIQRDIFNGANCEVIVVRNASKQDLLDVIQHGSSNTVLVVGGHGTLGSLSMTDGVVENATIPTPEKPLRAFIQHTCAQPDGHNQQMGDRWANTVYGWKRGTSPVDFLDNPLVLRD